MVKSKANTNRSDHFNALEPSCGKGISLVFRKKDNSLLRG